MTYFQALIVAIVQGLTEFLPVSSTGHMIITEHLLGIHSNDFVKLYTIIIQLASILAVVVLYFRRFIDPVVNSTSSPGTPFFKRMWEKYDFYIKLIVAFIPAAFFGLLLKKKIDMMLESVEIVSVSLMVGGIILLFVDKWFNKISENQQVSYSKAFRIGLFQVLSMIPGVSRSAATIVGGMSQKLSRKNAAEFSFFLAVPTMLAASGLELLQNYKSLDSSNLGVLIFGFVISFIVALLAIKTFISFLTNHGFRAFGYYRIAIGIIMLILILSGTDLAIFN